MAVEAADICDCLRPVSNVLTNKLYYE